MNCKQKLRNFLLTSVISFVVILLLSSSCYYDSEEYLYPQINGTCDTTNFTFTGGVKPILLNSCYGCHSNSTSASGNGIKLEDYADVKLKADDGSLLGSIAHSPGYSPMPLNAPKLESCSITVVQKWIESGASNN